MEQTMDFEKPEQETGNSTKDISGTMKTLKLARKIYKELEAGKSMEEVISERLPKKDVRAIQRDSKLLDEGVTSVYQAKNEEIDETWLEQRLNASMVDLTEKERVRYLGNLIHAVKTAYPDIQLDADGLDEMYALCEAEECTKEDVSMVLGLAEEALEGHAGLLKRQSVAAMNKRLYQLDHKTIEQQINSSEDRARAYAAACYIQQQCGEQMNVDGQDISGFPARLLGVAAATSIESSKLMEWYSVGKINLHVLQEKLKQLFLSAFTFVYEHVAKGGAYILQGLTACAIFAVLLPIMSYLLFFSPILIVLGTAALTYYAAAKFVTTSDFEHMIDAVLRFAKSLWKKCKGQWDKLFGDKAGDVVFNAADEDAEEEKDVDEEELEEETEDEEGLEEDVEGAEDVEEAKDKEGLEEDVEEAEEEDVEEEEDVVEDLEGVGERS